MTFKTIIFKDVCALIRGISYKSSNYTYANDKNAEFFVNLKCVMPDGFRKDGVKYYKGKHKDSQYVFPGDLLIANTDLTRNREIIGNSILVPDLDGCACFSMDLTKVEVTNPLLIDKKFLYYYLKAPQARWFMINHSDGSTVVHLSIKTIPDMEMTIPDLETQKKVAHILSALDEKIELNNRNNSTLESIMKTLFKDWIGSFAVEKKSNLAEIATYLNGLAMQKYRPQATDKLPVIKIKEMNSGFSSDTEMCDPSLIGEKYIVHDGDVLFAWSGTLCAKIWCGGDGGLNQHIFKVTSEKYPKWFYYFWTLEHLERFIQIAIGKATTMGHIKRSELSLSEVLIPSESELNRFDKIMSPMLNKYITNSIENRELASIRGSLLPKLMSDEISLDNVTIQKETV